MENFGRRYDVAVIGSGIAGAALAAILARHGFGVVVFEAKSHPRFSIGESMILETSEVMRALAEIYDVPELAYFSSENYFDYAGTSHGVKRHFSYLHHEAGSPHDAGRTLQAIIPKEPHGHELHLYRQDTDYFMVTTAIRHGASVLQNTPVEAVEIGGGGVEIVAGGRRYAADYVVDAGGFRSIVADKFCLRERGMQTHSRTLFTHMVDVPGYEGVSEGRKKYGLPFRLSEGTLHHVFEGGWMWVIPFNNHARSTNPLVSVGLQLDPRLYPERSDLTPEEEFRDFIQRYPSVAAHFEGAKAARDWVRAPRIQYTASRIVGDRWALLGHAAGFVDPLYSKGLYVSLASVSMLANLLLNARQSNDYGRDAFLPLETMTLNYVRSNDRLVANSYKSWGDYRLWRVYSVLWLLGAYTELLKLNSLRAHMREPRSTGDRKEYYRALGGLKLAGGGFDEYEALADEIDTLVEKVDVADEAAVGATSAKIEKILRSLEWMPDPFVALLDGKTYLPKNKLRLSMLDRERGFLRTGRYREHFFGDSTTLDLVRRFTEEKIKYSSFVLNRRFALTRW